VITPEDADTIAARLLAGLRTTTGGSHLAHARRVAEHVRLAHPDRSAHERDRAVVAALLHDVVEKAGVSVDEIRTLTDDERIVELVDFLTRRPDETEHAYLGRCASDPTALVIKRIDLLDKLVASDALVPADEVARIRRAAQRRIAVLDDLATARGPRFVQTATAGPASARAGEQFTLHE
jgi:(p)ppGpp synthase/HD superfamily hydrolase